jgi:hypothetical protein
LPDGRQLFVVRVAQFVEADGTHPGGAVRWICRDALRHPCARGLAAANRGRGGVDRRAVGQPDRCGATAAAPDEFHSVVLQSRPGRSVDAKCGPTVGLVPQGPPRAAGSGAGSATAPCFEGLRRNHLSGTSQPRNPRNTPHGASTCRRGRKHWQRRIRHRCPTDRRSATGQILRRIAGQRFSCHERAATLTFQGARTMAPRATTWSLGPPTTAISPFRSVRITQAPAPVSSSITCWLGWP